MVGELNPDTQYKILHKQAIRLRKSKHN